MLAGMCPGRETIRANRIRLQIEAFEVFVDDNHVVGISFISGAHLLRKSRCTLEAYAQLRHDEF